MKTRYTNGSRDMPYWEILLFSEGALSQNIKFGSNPGRRPLRSRVGTSSKSALLASIIGRFSSLCRKVEKSHVGWANLVLPFHIVRSQLDAKLEKEESRRCESQQTCTKFLQSFPTEGSSLLSRAKSAPAAAAAVTEDNYAVMPL